MIDAVAVIAAIGTLLGGITAAGLAKKWVFGWVYAAKEKEADFWRDAFLNQIGTTEKALDVATRKTPRG